MISYLTDLLEKEFGGIKYTIALFSRSIHFMNRAIS